MDSKLPNEIVCRYYVEFTTFDHPPKPMVDPLPSEFISWVHGMYHSIALVDSASELDARISVEDRFAVSRITMVKKWEDCTAFEKENFRHEV